MNKIKLKYDPNLSVRENAVRCGVSESAIRKFIRTNGIDRNYDNKVAKKRAILTLKEENPSISLAEMAHRLGYSVNTIRKYLQMDLGQSKITTSKVSTFDLSNKKFIIKSVSDDQTEILMNILRLNKQSKTGTFRVSTFDCSLFESL